VDRHGLVSPDDVGMAVKEHTVLVSVMYNNNEIGTIESIKEISEAIRRHSDQLGSSISFHTDAVQVA
jgi:cysteine desulfurase